MGEREKEKEGVMVSHRREAEEGTGIPWRAYEASLTAMSWEH